MRDLGLKCVVDTDPVLVELEIILELSLFVHHRNLVEWHLYRLRNRLSKLLYRVVEAVWQLNLVAVATLDDDSESVRCSWLDVESQD